MNSNGVLNSNRFVEKLGIQMLLRNVVIYMLLFTHHYPARCWHEYAKIPRHTSQNSIAAGNLE